MEKVEEKIKKIIVENLGKDKDYKLFIFGSRASEKYRKYSDYDIGIEGKKAIPFETLAKIKIALKDSDLPYNIDVVDFAGVSKNFREQALKKIKKL